MWRRTSPQRRAGSALTFRPLVRGACSSTATRPSTDPVSATSGRRWAPASALSVTRISSHSKWRPSAWWFSAKLPDPSKSRMPMGTASMMVGRFCSGHRMLPPMVIRTASAISTNSAEAPIPRCRTAFRSPGLSMIGISRAAMPVGIRFVLFGVTWPVSDRLARSIPKLIWRMDGLRVPISRSMSRKPGPTRSPTSPLLEPMHQVVSTPTRMAMGCRMRGSASIFTRRSRHRPWPMRMEMPSTTSLSSSVAVIRRISTNPPWVWSAPTTVGTGPPAICAMPAMAFGRWLFRSSNPPRQRTTNSVSGRPKTTRTGDSRRHKNPMASNRTSIFSGRSD